MSKSLSSGRVRSKTGCLTCKKRRKKCDETRPVCERCTKAGMDCLGYSYLEDSGDKILRIRSKAAARVSAARSSTTTPDTDDFPRPGPSQLRASTLLATPASTDATHSPNPVFAHTSLPPLIPGVARENVFPTAGHHLGAMMSSVAPNNFDNNTSVFDFSFLSPSQFGLPFDSQLGEGTGWGGNFSLDGSSSAPHFAGLSDAMLGSPFDQPATGGSSGTPDAHQSALAPRGGLDPKPNPLMTTGQASLYNALFSLGEPPAEASLPTPAPSYTSYTTPSSSHGSTWPSPDTEKDDSDSATSEESDPEGVKEIVCGTPTLDVTVQSNSLPFALQSYANWMTRTVYEPLKLAHKVRGWITSRYTESEDSRTSVTMFAGLLNTLWKSGAVAAEYMPVASMVGERVRSRVIQASSRLRLGTTSDAEASKALDEAMELLAIQCLTTPVSSLMSLLVESAPLFRRACPEAPHELIDLPTKFIHPDMNLRHFAAMDIILGVSLGRPMLFRYDVHYDRALCNGIMVVEDMGLQWLNGIPDQIVLLLAKMNMLRDDFAPNMDPSVVSDIEQELREFSPRPGISTDAYLMIARLAVQECWRLVVYIYLYMALCGASSTDPRVEKHHKSFMRLLERTKPGRTPDSFLIMPMILAGTASQRQRDRSLIRQRLLALRECSEPGTSGNDGVHILENIWARSNAEGRPATWMDLKAAASRVVHALV